MKNTHEGRTLNVLLITTNPHGGAGLACMRLQSALHTQGVAATVLTQPEVGGRIPFLAERISFLPWERDKSVRFRFSLANFGTDISRHPAVMAADVIHLHWWNQGFLSLQNLAALGALGKPIVWTLHDMWAFTGGCHYTRGCSNYKEACGNCLYLRFRYRTDLSHQVWAKKKALFPKNMHIVACSRWLASDARASSLLRDYPIVDIPNPIDTNQFIPQSEEKRSAFRQKIGARPGAHLLLFAAMNIGNPYKGFPFLKNALAILKERNPHVPIEIVAVGKCKTDAMEGVPYPIHYMGLISNTDEMAEIYACTDVFVTPSLEDNLPNTIMESLASGTPVVGFEVGGIPEMIEDGISGKVTPFKDSSQLADDIVWVLEDEDRRKTLGQNARAKVMRDYGQEVVAKRYMDVYDLMVNK